MKSQKFFIALVIVFALFLALLNQLHVITQWFANPPNTLFTGIAHYYADYFLYVSHFAQGAQGNLAIKQMFTNEPMGTTWIYWFNALLGRIGSTFGLSVFATYNIALFFLVIFLVVLWYVFAKRIFKTPLVAFSSVFFICTASNFFDIGAFLHGKLELAGQFWFSPTPALNRLGGVPHQVFQTILFVLLTLWYARLLEKEQPQKPLHYALLGLLTILAATANPIQMLLFVLAATMTTGVLWRMKKRLTLALFIPLSTLALLALPSALLTNKAFDLPVLTAAKVWENAQYVSVSLPAFFVGVGPVAILAAIGTVLYLRRLTPLTTLFGLYGLLSFVFFFTPLPKLLGTTNVRYLHPAPYAILGILATYALLHLSQLLPKIIERIVHIRISSNTISVSLFVLYCLFTIPSFAAQVIGRTDPKQNTILTSSYNHVPNGVVDALLFLGKRPFDSRPVVVTDPSLPYDVLVPVLADKISFTGHPLHTLYLGVKESLRKDLFDGKITGSSATTLFTNHRVGYLLSSASDADTIMRLPGVKKIFTNDRIVLFAVSP